MAGRMNPMLAKLWSAAVRGVEGYPVAVELDLASGLPSYATVGLPDSAVRESRERVVSALRNSGYQFPSRRVTVNLAPAELRKRGTQFDLPVALSVLSASGQLQGGEWMGRFCFLGELALDGTVKPVSGVLPMTAAARARGLRGVVVSKANAREAAAAGVPSYGVGSLREAAEFVSGARELEAAAGPVSDASASHEDLREVKGQELARRALEIAAAGGHNLLLTGPPGSGKSMLARRLPGILPPLTEDEALETAMVLSASGALAPGGWPAARPFRAPHHTVPPAALVGGGAPARPGEVTLAHRGVLFLDELPEFRRESLEALRVPLESGRSVVCRLRETVEYPAEFQLVAARNPCPCGSLGHPARECSCPPGLAARYRRKVSGPLLERIDLRVEVAPVSFEQWAGDGGPGGEGSAAVGERVGRARKVQAGRQGAPSATNARMGPSDVRRHCVAPPEGRRLLEAACRRHGLSARTLDRVLKVARTVADLDGCDGLSREHIAEALVLCGAGLQGEV